jgi:diguanylate cyclase (GGDEF)-like protein
MDQITAMTGAFMPGGRPANDDATLAQLAIARCAAISDYRILDTPEEPAFDDIVRFAARICGTAYAALSFVTDDRQWFKAQLGLGARETPISQSFCAHAIRQEDLFLVKDAARDPIFAAYPNVTGPPYIRFYAGAPIRAADGTPMATLCVIDPKPRPRGISRIKRDTLRLLAAQIETQLELRRALIARDEQAAAQQHMARELAHVAHHDALTGLPNRRVFQARCADAVTAAIAAGRGAAVMMIDVDHFKQINDSLGHDAGDTLLRHFAQRLRQAVRHADVVTRLGGDEFGVILSNVGGGEQLAALVASVHARLRQPLDYEGRAIECQASIGVARCPEHASSVAGMMKCSDLALAQAKVTRDCAVIFKPALARQFQAKVNSLTKVRTMLRETRIVPHYQPKIDLRSGATIGFEALLRWQLPGGKAIARRELLEAGLSNRELSKEIGAQMFERVFADIAGWTRDGIAFGRIAVNICAADFAGNDFAERLLATLGAHAVSPTAIELEITEGVFLGRGSHHVGRALAKLAESGVRIALDDFGTGYASLAHLKRFPVHVLKIDRSFVSGLGRNPDDSTIVRALIALGSSLGVETVAEGIETVEQEKLVQAYGCDVGQGFLYGAARPASEVPAMVDRATVCAAA